MAQSRKLRPPLTCIQSFLACYAEQNARRSRQVRCLEIGANDGKTNDPIYPWITRHGWRAVLLEPQADICTGELAATYANHPNVSLENAALASTDGTAPFYRISFSQARWATGLAGFDRQSLQRHIDSGYVAKQAETERIQPPSDRDQWIETVQVPTISMLRLLQKHQIANLEVMAIDTEGFDFEILKLVPFDLITPEVVLFESKNLSDRDYAAAQKMLRDRGYRLYWEKGDTLAVKWRYPLMVRALHGIRAAMRKL